MSTTPTPKARPQRIPSMPRVYKRRPYEDDKPGGYLEGFTDYAANNRPAVEWFLENAATVRAAVAMADRAGRELGVDAAALCESLNLAALIRAAITANQTLATFAHKGGRLTVEEWERAQQPLAEALRTLPPGLWDCRAPVRVTEEAAATEGRRA